MIFSFCFFLLIFFPRLSTPFSFDSQSCRMKCESLFADSPTKLSLCLKTCSSTSIPPSLSTNSKSSSSTTSQKASSKPQYANMYVYDRASNRYTRQKVIVLSSTTTTTTKTTSSQSTSLYQNQNRLENITKCLNNCNGDLDSRAIREKGEFTKWMKCRQYCFTDSSSNNQESSEFPFFDDSDNQEICDQECDRYWKGTVHWKPCIDQCQNINLKKESSQQKSSPKNDKESIYDIW